MQESTLHNQLKNFYTPKGGVQEAWVDGFLVDILTDERVIEIQTRNFSAIKPKLDRLLSNHSVLLVYPLVREKWIVRQDGEHLSRRRSPRRGRIEDIFFELIRFPGLMEHPNLILEVIFIQVEELRINDGKGSWRRRGWSIGDRRILHIGEQIQFRSPADFVWLLPPDLNSEFTVRELAAAANLPLSLARKMAYCLRQMNLVKVVGKRRNAHVLVLG
jgi:hypothetical protein